MKNLKIQSISALILSITMLILLSCSDETGLNSGDNSDLKIYSESSEFAIYIAKNSIRYNQTVDYSKINLDTVELLDSPFLTSSQIESYDTINHIINLKQSKFDLDYPSSGVFGQLFIIFANNEPVYCGFFWSIISSVPCNWIFIEDPNEQNGLTDKQIQISAGYPDFSHFHGIDPRNDSRIIDIFSQNGKLIGNSIARGNGLNFYVVILST